MSVVQEPHNDEGRAVGRPQRKPAQSRVLATVCLAAAFMGLIVLPETRANIWWPSSAGDSGFLVGP